MTDTNDKMAQLSLGDSLNNNRYIIIADQSANQESYPVYAVKQHTYIAQDTISKPSKTVSLRVLGVESSSSVYSQNESQLLQTLGSDSILHEYVLAPRETFWHQEKNGKQEKGGKHLCMVYDDLFGPDLWYMGEVTGPESNLYPASMIWKMAKDALESLAYLDSNRICHGDINPTSLVLTYTNLDATKSDKVLGFYGQPNNFGGIQSLNETATGKEGTPFNMESWRLKIIGLGKALMDEKPDDPSEYIQSGCPPPELLFENILLPSADVWNLALILSDLAAGTPEFATLIGGNSGTPLEKLLEARSFLGELPSQYLEAIPSGQDVPRLTHTEDALFTAIRDGPRPSGVKRFATQDIQILVHLLKRMLAYNAEDRYSAEQALAHEFFKVQRPTK